MVRAKAMAFVKVLDRLRVLVRFRAKVFFMVTVFVRVCAYLIRHIKVKSYLQYTFLDKQK